MRSKTSELAEGAKEDPRLAEKGPTARHVLVSPQKNIPANRPSHSAATHHRFNSRCSMIEWVEDVARSTKAGMLGF